MTPHRSDSDSTPIAGPEAYPEGPMELSVVVPCYNEEDVLPEVHRRLTSVCGRLDLSYELVFVNDGSKDRSWPIMLGLSADDPNLVLVNLARNHGQQLALTAGLSVCRGRRALILDADLQDPPELLPEMIRLMDSGADVVYGVRRRRDGEGRLKLWTATLFYRLIERLVDDPFPRDTGDFRLISRRALDVLLTMPERRRFIRGMISWIGFRQEPLPYDRHARYAGATKYSLGNMTHLAIDAITSFSVRPLALASWGGGVTGLLAGALMLGALASWIAGEVVPGWTILLAAVALMGSVQLVALGILGEYVGRMFEESRRRPLFLIERVVRSVRRPCAGAMSGDDTPVQDPSDGERRTLGDTDLDVSSPVGMLIRSGPDLEDLALLPGRGPRGG